MPFFFPVYFRLLSLTRRRLMLPVVFVFLMLVGLGSVSTQRACAQTYAGWTACDIATSKSNDTRLLWRTPDNKFQVWNLNNNGVKTQSSILFGPITTEGFLWTPVRIGVGGDGLTRLLLTRSDGAATVWTLNPDLSLGGSTIAYGPYAGWTPVDMAVARDGSLRLLWTTAAGQASLWNIDTAATVSISPTYGAFADTAGGNWNARRIGVGGDGLVRVLWATAGGQASLWTLDGALNRTGISPTFGPYANTKPLALALDTTATSSNKTHLLWPRSDGAATFWRLGVDNATLEINAGFGPYGGWTVQALSVGGDGQMRALWTHTDGYTAFWKLAPDGTSFPVNVTFPPYSPTPLSPVRLTSAPGNGQVTLSWGLNPDANSQSLTGFGVKRATTTGGPYTILTSSLGTGAASYLDSGLVNGTTYYYRVFPIFGAGYGTDSNEVAVVPQSLSTPTITLTATTTTRSLSSGAVSVCPIYLSWSASVSYSQYAVWRGNSQIDTTTSSFYQDNAPGGAYMIRGLTAQGYWVNSNIVSIVAGDPNSVTSTPSGSSSTGGSFRWSSGPAMASSGISYPWNGISWQSGSVHRLSAFSPIDWDVLTATGFPLDQLRTGTGVCAWSADGGTFPEGTRGSTVLWQAPVVTTPTTVTFYLQVTDGNTGSTVGRNEGGTRVDTPILAADRPLQFQVSVNLTP